LLFEYLSPTFYRFGNLYMRTTRPCNSLLYFLHKSLTSLKKWYYHHYFLASTKLLSISTVPSAEPPNKLESCSGIPPQVRASLVLALVIPLFSISVLPPCKRIPSCPTLLTLLLSRALVQRGGNQNTIWVGWVRK